MTLNRLVAILAALTILAVVVEFLFVSLSEHTKGHSPYFIGLFALVSVAAALVLIVAAKLLGRFWLDRPEDYYD